MMRKLNRIFSKILCHIFIFLLLHTRENDATWFKKLFASAKRRKNVDMIKIDIAMQR